jgi:hypothetical protein
MNEDKMAEFFEKTWFLWWVVASVVIARWFHVAADDIADEISVPDDGSSQKPTLGRHLNSSLT